MKKSNLISVLVIGFMLLNLLPTLVLSQDKLRKEGRYYIADIVKEFKVKKGGNLVMEDVRGDITVNSWNKKVVKIHELRKMDVYTKAEAEAVLKDAKSLYSKEGNTIRVGSEGSFRSYMNSRFTVNLPAEFNIDLATKGGDLSVTDLKGTAELKTSGGDIDLIRVNGLVNAKTSGGDVTVKKNTDKVKIKTSGGDIEVIDVEGEVDAKTSGGEIVVRNNKAKVKAHTSGGSIELVNVGAEVDAHTSGGDIDVDGSAGDIKVSTSGGDVELKNINGQATAKTSGGDIEAINVKNGIAVKTSGGDIELEDIQGFIEAATSGGDIEAEMTLKDFSKDHHVELKSSGGDLTLLIPAKLPATINAEIKLSGTSWGNKDYDIYSDFSLKREQEKSGSRVDVIYSHGKINGGGDLINLKTTNGNIRIKKIK